MLIHQVGAIKADYCMRWIGPKKITEIINKFGMRRFASVIRKPNMGRLGDFGEEPEDMHLPRKRKN
jgi:hypothetical protein